MVARQLQKTPRGVKPRLVRGRLRFGARQAIEQFDSFDITAVRRAVEAFSHECGAVLVRRWDSSDYASTANMGDVYDPVDTKFGYEVEFGGDRDAALEISNYQARYGQKSDAKFDGINVTLAAAPAADGYAIKPAYREPSAPTRVKLFSVSRTNLGVAWAPPAASTSPLRWPQVVPVGVAAAAPGAQRLARGGGPTGSRGFHERESSS